MRVKLDYDELFSVLGFTGTVLSDKSVDDKLKRYIFLVDKETVKVVGYNPFTFARTTLEKAELEDIPDEGWEFQIRADVLNKIISSFSNLSRTRVGCVDLSRDGVRVKVTVHEVPVNEEDVRFAQDSEFMLESAPILPNILRDIHMKFPNDIDSVISEEIGVYIDTLLPLVSNDVASTTGSKLFFAEDYVFVISSMTSGFMQNNLPEAFKSLTLSHSSVSFLKRLCDSSEAINVCKIDKYLCIESGNTQAFMRYQKPSVQHKAYTSRLSKEKGISLDRPYLKDVLKRMKNISNEGVMTIEHDDLVVENSNFQQSIPLSNIKDGTVGLSFKVGIPVIESAILGRDDVFTSDVFMYFVQKPRGYILYILDKSGVWMSVCQVNNA